MRVASNHRSYLAAGLMLVACLVLHTGGVQALQQTAAEGYATILGLPTEGIHCMHKFLLPTQGEEEWRTEDVLLWVADSDGAFLGLLCISGEAPFNQGATPVTSDAEATARASQFLSQYAQALGLPTPLDTDVLTVQPGDGFSGRSVEWRRYDGDVPGLPDWVFNIDDAGRVLDLAFTRVPGALPSATPDLTVAQATALVAAEVSDQVTLDESDLEIWPVAPGDARLLWRLELSGVEYESYSADVDAHTGEVLSVAYSLGRSPDESNGLPLPALAVAAMVRVLSAVIAKVFAL